MRILHLLDEPWDSGITHYALQIAENLKKQNHDIVLGVRPGKKPEAMAKKLGLQTIPICSPIHVYQNLKKNNWDLINVHTGKTHTWSILARKLSGKKAIPIVRTRGDARALKINPLSRYVYRHTDGVIAASDHVRKQYEVGFGINEEMARTIYPYVQADEKIQKSPQKRVGILGRLDPVKGHTIFLEAASKVLNEVPDVEFAIAGKEANVSEQLLQNHAKQLGIADQVRFLGFQPSAQIFMRSCTVGVISSIGSEEVSRACLEWMGVGRPVVGTLVGCLPELIEPQESGFLVPPEDSNSLAQALLKILKDSSLAEQFGKTAKALAERRFSAQIQLEKTLRLYNWAIDQKGRS